MDNHCCICGAYLTDTGRMICEKCEKPKKAELKPCPFCGGRAHIDHYMQPKEEWRIRCMDCPTKFGRCAGLDKKEAIEAWNRKAEDGKNS